MRKLLKVFSTSNLFNHSRYACGYLPVARTSVSAALTSCAAVNGVPPAVEKR